ncbi:ketopantoate reductase family protein [bacterium]|nr:ketopantoate reductase family protein [bacterium]
MEIQNVIIYGLGAIGLTYAAKLNNACNLFILADENRINKYKENPPQLNGNIINLNYITPEDNKNIDLIIISTKYNGLNSAINDIKKFVNEDTVIISLINGINSENEISAIYGEEKVLHSYFVGHSAMRDKNRVIQDGVGKIYFGSPNSKNKDKVKLLKNFFDKCNIDYEIPNDIIYSMWVKFTLNVFANQISAIFNMNFGEMKKNLFIKFLSQLVINETVLIAKKENLTDWHNLKNDTLAFFDIMSNDGISSTLQDLRAKRKTEAEIFSGQIIKLAKKHGVSTPFNVVLYKILKFLEKKY